VPSAVRVFGSHEGQLVFVHLNVATTRPVITGEQRGHTLNQPDNREIARRPRGGLEFASGVCEAISDRTTR
jgi:hypothetical protein